MEYADTDGFGAPLETRKDYSSLSAVKANIGSTSIASLCLIYLPFNSVLVRAVAPGRAALSNTAPQFVIKLALLAIRSLWYQPAFKTHA